MLVPSMCQKSVGLIPGTPFGCQAKPAPIQTMPFSVWLRPSQAPRHNNEIAT